MSNEPHETVIVFRPFRAYTCWCSSGLRNVRPGPSGSDSEQKDAAIAAFYKPELKEMVHCEILIGDDVWALKPLFFQLMIGNADIQHSVSKLDRYWSSSFTVSRTKYLADTKTYENDSYLGKSGEAMFFYGEENRDVHPLSAPNKRFKSVSVPFDIPALPSFDETCSVCLADHPNEEVLPCGHHFHTNCLWRYLQQKQLVKQPPARCVQQQAELGRVLCAHREYVKTTTTFPCPNCAQQ